MFCPLCKAEYRAGFIRCKDCDADLVPRLEEPFAQDVAGKSPAILWRGEDPVVFTAILNALHEARIPYHSSPSRDYLADFSSPIPPGLWGMAGFEVRLFCSELKSAQRVLKEVLEPLTVGPPSGSATERPSEVMDTSQEEIRESLYSGQAITEVWAGEEAAMAQFVKDIFRENAIGCHVLSGEPGTVRILVHPEDEDRAREIVRDIVKGTPPE